MKELSFRVNGLPAPQGSKRHVGNGRMIEASKKVGPWRAAVFEAVASLDFEPFANECSIEIVFYLEKPKTVKRILPTVPPDLDKLIRGLLDALTLAHVWLDDALAVDITAVKIYASKVDPPGAQIIIREIVDPAAFDWGNRWLHGEET
jgi:crossover junction endodeoxyribonuclease RusA